MWRTRDDVRPAETCAEWRILQRDSLKNRHPVGTAGRAPRLAVLTW